MPAIDRNLLPRGCLIPRPDRGPSHSPWVNVASIPSDFMTSRFARACIGPGSRPYPETEPNRRLARRACWIMLCRYPYFKAVPETHGTIHCVCGWLHAPSQSLPIRFRSSRPFFGEFEGSESEVGRTGEFRGPRDAGNNVSTSLSSGFKKSNGDRCSGCSWRRSAVSLHRPLPLR